MNISYFSRFTTAETFTHLALLETHHRGLENAGAVAAVMDGADWLQQFTDYHCPKAVRILDFAHAAQHVAAVAQALWGQDSAATTTWTQQWTSSLKEHGPQPLLAELRRLQAVYPSSEPLSLNLAYLEKRQVQMHYPRFRQQGWPIGSGMVESANKLVVEARLKGAGMHWQRGNVDAMLALRNLLCNDRWEQEWPHIKTRLVTQARHRRFLACRQRLHTAQTQEQEAARAVQHAQYVALHPAWLVDPQPAQLPDPPPPPTPKSAKPARDHPWRRSPIGNARFTPLCPAGNPNITGNLYPVTASRIIWHAGFRNPDEVAFISVISPTISPARSRSFPLSLMLIIIRSIWYKYSPISSINRILSLVVVS
jgi:hypothetical protein